MAACNSQPRPSPRPHSVAPMPWPTLARGRVTKVRLIAVFPIRLIPTALRFDRSSWCVPGRGVKAETVKAEGRWYYLGIQRSHGEGDQRDLERGTQGGQASQDRDGCEHGGDMSPPEQFG